MQAVNYTTQEAMERQTVKALPEAVFEFNHSLLSELSVNAPEGKDETLFPKESVIEQRYVNSGIPTAIVGQSLVQDRWEPQLYRASSPDDTFKYWVSPTLSTPQGINDAWMEVVYDRDRPTNKIQAVFDVTWARPSQVNVDIRQGSTWRRAATGVAPNTASGVLAVYPQANGTWGTSYSVDHPVDVRGVRITATTMSRVGTYAHFISIAAMLRVDMTEKIVSFDVNKSLDNASVLAPIGESSSQSLDISLENEDGLFDPQNENSIYYDLLSRNVRVETAIKVENTESISQGTFYAESWNYSAPGVEIGAAASDVTRFMQEIYLPQFVLRNYRLHEAVQDILARAGFKVDQFILRDSPVVPFIWYNEEVTLWQALKDLANATMSYFYIDENDRFIWIDFASMSRRNPSMTFDADENLVDLSHNFDVISNHITVNYNIYGTPVDEVGGNPVTQEVWSPGEDVALLSMPLRSTLSAGGSTLTLDTNASGMDLWPDEGIVAIQGEYLRYTGKNRGARQLTGLQRGYLDSVARAHSAPSLGTRGQVGTTAGSMAAVRGSLRMTSPAAASRTGYNFSLHGTTSTRKEVYGTRVRFPSSSKHETAGLRINGGTGWTGLYVEISTTSKATEGNRGEIMVYTRNEDRSHSPVYASVPYRVSRSSWYDIEITCEYTQTTPAYSVYVNGMLVTSFRSDIGNGRGRWGPMVRGRTIADFERIYSANTGNRKVGGTRYQDEVAGGNYQSDFIYNSGDPYIEVNDFVPQVRQVMEFNVDYAKYPVTQSSIFNTNHWQVRVFKFTGGPFGSSFYLENKSDFTAVVNGTSPNLFPDPTPMTMIAFGDPVVIDSESRKVVKDALSVRRNGRVEIEVSNPWIQTDEMAQNVADLIVNNFSDPMDTISVTVFPNYALQIGDVVRLSYPERGYRFDTHSYYVLDITTAWSDGFSQTLTLRRKR